MLYVVAHFDDFTHDLMTGVGEPMTWECGWCDTKVAFNVYEMEVAAAHTSQAITNTHPTWRGQ